MWKTFSEPKENKRKLNSKTVSIPQKKRRMWKKRTVYYSQTAGVILRACKRRISTQIMQQISIAKMLSLTLKSFATLTMTEERKQIISFILTKITGEK